MSYDPRSVANLLLDLADQEKITISNLAIQKLLYFAHTHFLIKIGRPLMHGAFEAWTHGPVHPAIYQAFKLAGRDHIRDRAAGRDIMTGLPRPLATPTDPEVLRCIRRVLDVYGHLSPKQLRDLSHAPGSPWYIVVKAAETSVTLGMRIPDSVIREHFRYLAPIIGNDSRTGDIYEDTPLTGN